SPPCGFSTLTTSAPSQASASVQDGPASNWVRSRTRTPARKAGNPPFVAIFSSSPQWHRLRQMVDVVNINRCLRHSVKSSELHARMTQLEIYHLRGKHERGCEPGRGSTFTIRLPKDCRRSEGSGGRQSGPHRRAGAETSLVDFAALHEFGSGTMRTNRDFCYLSAFQAKRKCRGRRERFDLTKMTQSGHGATFFVAMHPTDPLQSCYIPACSWPWGKPPHEAARVHRTSRQHGACEAASPCRFRHRKHRRSLSPEFRQAFALLLRPDKFVMSFRGPQSDSPPSLKGESDDSCRSYYDADRTVFDYKAESRRRNLLCALGMPALTGGICGLQRGCCPRARNGAGTRLPRCLELAVFWCDGHCRRSNIEYPKQCVGLLDQSRRPPLGRYGSDFLHTTPRIHAALARRCRSGPVGARLGLYHTRLCPTASTTATISAMKLGACTH